VNEVQGAGERQFESSLEQLDKRCAGLDTGTEWTEQQIETGADSAQRPSDDQQNQQPDERPADRCSVCHEDMVLSREVYSFFSSGAAQTTGKTLTHRITLLL
jgi:hypothetical protein